MQAALARHSLFSFSFQNGRRAGCLAQDVGERRTLLCLAIEEARLHTYMAAPAFYGSPISLMQAEQ